MPGASATRSTGGSAFSEKRYELALVYCDGFDNLYSSLGQWYRSNGAQNISGIGDSKLDELFDEVGQGRRHGGLGGPHPPSEQEDQPAWSLWVNLFKLEKSIYSRGIKDVAIATDNPFLSVEDWSL